MFKLLAYVRLWSIMATLCTFQCAYAGPPATFETLVKPFLQEHCLDCHGDDTPAGNIALQDLAEISPQNAQLWQQIWEQVALRQMPPEAQTDQPHASQRLTLTNFITSELARVMHDHGGFQKHLHPSKGNHLDHDLLFGELPAGLEPTSTPARIWRIHPQEHLTRLSALINHEPAFVPSRPGLRARGDFIPPNEDGEVKVYFGLDRVIGWVGGTAAYAAAITGFPPILSTDDTHGLRNYAHLYSVNGPEATQIANTAENILRFMAFGPQAEPYQFADDVKEIDEKYKHGDLRGLAQSVFYAKEIKRPLTPVYDLVQSLAHNPQPEADALEPQLQAAVHYLFQALSCRPPTPAEARQYIDIAQQAIQDLGPTDGAILGLVPIFLDRDALFRSELAEQGLPDEFGRVMLQDQELGLAINAAFSYLPPDAELQRAIEQGRLKTRDDVQREVSRILADATIRKPRVLQFFREFFDYDRAGRVCKDTAALLAAGGTNKTQDHYRAMFDMTASTDRLIELILQEDKDVLRQLLTTDRVVLNVGDDAAYFGEYVSSTRPPKDPAAPKNAAQRRVTVEPLQAPEGETEHVRIAQVVQVGKTARSKTERLLTSLPADQRMGILTHPSWLVSHSDAMDNHAIHRGKWIRERLLGGAVPDVPITVDAMLPDEPNETLRQRMRVTREEYCWKCHQQMDPLGLPFEMYNHLGLYRQVEQEQPVDTSGAITDSGDPALDGPVNNALELIQKLAHSQRVEQVFVRHAFRFWMGRNETLQDAPVLQAAHIAYRDNGGSLQALLTALLTSDAFLYRTVKTRASVGCCSSEPPGQ
jgi:hypothetical protein